jgi:hypothetical protein
MATEINKSQRWSGIKKSAWFVVLLSLLILCSCSQKTKYAITYNVTSTIPGSFLTLYYYTVDDNDKVITKHADGSSEPPRVCRSAFYLSPAPKARPFYLVVRPFKSEMQEAT